MKKLITFFTKYRFEFCLYTLLVFVLTVSYAKYYFDDMLLIGGDGLVTEVTTLSFIKESLKSGEYPLWNKYLSIGMPMAGNPSMRIFYLPNLILSFLPLKPAVYCEYILHVSIGAMFFFLLLKQIGCRKRIAAVMAFVYQFSINLGGARKEHMPIIITAIYLPIIIYFIEKYLETEEYKWLIYASCAMALQFCGGFMQCILYSDIFVGIYLVVGLLKRGIFEKNWLKYRKWSIHLILWFCSYFGLIAIQLVPFIEFLKENSQYDKTIEEYQNFIGFSLHPIKLLQMIFPKIFIDEFSFLGAQYSSELDIELYMGPVIIILLICGILIYRKEYRIKAYVLASILVFCWASIARFPLVARLACKIPLIGKTRCQSRILFIFCFLILLMVGYIGELVSSRKDYEKFIKKVKFVISAVLVFIFTAFAGAFMYVGAYGFKEEELNNLVTYFKTSYYKDIILYVLCLFILLYFCHNEHKQSEKHRFALLALLLIINLVGVLPHSLRTYTIPINDLLGINNAQDDFLKENIGNHKVFDDLANVNGGHWSSISQNKSVVKKIPALNSYTNFSNPGVYMMMSKSNSAPLNNSGMLTGNVWSGLNLAIRNDVLSMWGIKYIIDSEGYLADNTCLHSLVDGKQDVLYLDKIEGKGVGELFIFGNAISLKPKTIYKITFNGSAVTDTSMYCDFISEQYYRNWQQYEFVLTEEKKYYESFIFSGESVPEQITFRFVCPNMSSDILIENVQVTEMERSGIETYQLVNSEGEYNIYENLNVNDIIYFSNVVNLQDGQNIYEATGLCLDENSYIEDGEELRNTSLNKKIVDTDFGINSIRANVYTDEYSFVNFSQTYFPGWKVYVDGVEQQIYTVNGVIMGTYVPIGSHLVEFCYKPKSVLIGGVISFITLFILIALNIKKRR